MRMRPNWPGVISRPGLGKTARARIVPERAIDLVVDEIHAALRATSPARPSDALRPELLVAGGGQLAFLRAR